MPHFLPFALLALPACGDKAEVPVEEDGDSGGDDSGPQGKCYEIEDYDGPVSVVDCRLEAPCDDIIYSSLGYEDGISTYEPKTARCIQDALAAGDSFVFSFHDRDTGGQFTRTWTLQSLGEGTVIWEFAGYIDDSRYGYATWRALPDSSWFDSCDVNTSDGFLDCMTQIQAEDCQTGDPTCP